MLNHRIRVDLHIHSNESWHKDEPLVKESDIAHLDVLLGKLEEYGINLISITDHNYLNAPLYREIERAISEKRCPCLQGVIPGVELDVVLEEGMKGCHVMAYFNVKKPEQYDHIANVLEKHSKRDQNFKYSRQMFENVIYEIGLPAILLAFQRRDPEGNPNGGRDQSFSSGVADYRSYLRVGYISGFDLNKPMVEGMIRSRLAQVKSIDNVASLIASDCHQWSEYPWHSAAKRGKTTPSFSEYNALPTFRGLQMALTSPETRFNRSESPDCRAIRSITIDNTEVPLSPGINAIIGDNGSGKSTLLHILAGKPAKHQRVIAENNHIKVATVSENVRLVEQASLVNAYSENTELERTFGIDYYPTLNSSGFQSAIAEYVELLKGRIRKEIDAHAFMTEKSIDLEVPTQTFHVTIVHESINPLDDEEVSSRVKALSEVVRIVDTELRAESYSDDQRRRLTEAMNLFDSVLAEKRDELAGARATNRAIGVIGDQVEEYKGKIAR